MLRTTLIALAACLLWSACNFTQPAPINEADIVVPDTLPKEQLIAQPVEKPEVVPPPKGWTDIAQVEPGIIHDIRYATDNNFIGKQIYDCPRCWLRPDVAEALVKIHQELQKEKLGLKVFDCYRPRPMQQRLWEVKPDPRYVTNPAKGSMHNRGAAVDLTIVDSLGQQLDMGTAFDFFGKEAWHEYQGHSSQILANRKKLKTIMEANGFRSIRTEWWHYAFVKGGNALSDELWPCGENHG